MAVVQSPLLGYNTNVRYRGRVFHVQTEDSGITKPHVITHLFADGGRIIKSVKRGYADILEQPDVPGQVKKLMQEQHKAMLLSLRSGEHDAQIGFETDGALETAATQEIAPEKVAEAVASARESIPELPPMGEMPTLPKEERVSPAKRFRAPWAEKKLARDEGGMARDRSLDEVILLLLVSEVDASV